MDAGNEVIVSYYRQGYTGLEIISLLKSNHSVSLSERHLRRVLARLCLQRRKLSPLEDVINTVQAELKTSGICLGYRAMWHRLRTYHQLNVSSETVRHLLIQVDPDGVLQRRRHRLKRRTYRTKGPLYTVHVDGYDKMKPHGFPIHGAICGFSRKVLWLRVGRSNNNPHIVAGYYLDFVREMDGVPRKIRCDRGTENLVMLRLQMALRSIHEDEHESDSSVCVGPSTSNQRIEQWWGILRNTNAKYWIGIFKDMEEEDLFSRDSEIQLRHLLTFEDDASFLFPDSFRECLRFCFMELIQKELDQVRFEWNTHRLQGSRGQCPSGKPDLLFNIPEAHDAVSYNFPVPRGVIDELEADYVVRERQSGTTEEYEVIFSDIMRALGLKKPLTGLEGMELYARLLTVLQNG